MNSQLVGLAEGGNKLNEAAGQVHTHLAHVGRTMSKGNHRQFFRALEHFQRSVSQLQFGPTPRNELISRLTSEIEEFSNLYDAFLSNQSGKQALPLVLSAQRLHIKLQLLFDLLQLFEATIGTTDVPSDSEAHLALWLPSHLDLTDFARRLLALQSLYSELCMLFSISENDHPLRISKIESGSLWAKVFGESKVIEMMVSFLEQTASWMYRTYTTEGRLASIPRKVEAIDALLGLTTRLKEAGLDSSSMQSHIEKSAVIISKNLAELLERQGSVTVNDKTISVNTELSKMYLEKVESLRLDTSSAHSHNEDQPTLPPPK